MRYQGADVAGRVSEELADRYLARLGVEREPPSADALDRLHRAQVESVPYETVWLHLGEAWTIDPVRSFERIALHGRGGYCYHVNGAFALLLEHLGYDVTLHCGGVHGPDGPTAESMENHLVLTVHGLPTADNPSGDWYVDAGLGEGLHGPLPLIAGIYRQGPLTLELSAVGADGIGDWHLAHDPRGAFAGMSFAATPVAGIDVFAARHEVLSTSPDSVFVRTVSVQRRHADGVDSLRGCVVSRWRSAATTEQVIDRRADWLAALDDLRLGLDLATVAPEALDAAWARIHAGHEAWLTGRRIQ